MRHSVLLLDTEPRTQNYYITLAIADALRRNEQVDRVVLGSHGDAIRRVQDENLNTLLAFGGSERHTPLMAKLCGLVELSILWTTEDPYQLAGNVTSSACFDVVFTNDRASVQAYKGRAHHLPLAASTLFQNYDVRTREEEYRYDVLFIGTAWPNRVRTLNRVIESLGPKAKTKLALPWNEFIGPPDLSQDDLITEWRCGNRDFARLVNSSRVVLTLPRRFSAAGAAQSHGSTPPPRLFETALAGGFQIAISPDDEIERYYDTQTEILTCPDDADAIVTIRSALQDPKARIEMAQRARTRTQREHLYDHRVATLLELAAGQEAPRLPPIRQKRKVVLFVTHNRLGRLSGGGVELYQEMLASDLTEYEFVFLYPTAIGGRRLLCVEGIGFSYEIEAETMRSDLLEEPGIERVFQEVLIRHSVDLVHFHHLLYLTLSLPKIARAYGIPTVWHVHDYYLICDRYNLITIDRRFCDVVNKGEGQCDTCLLALDGRPPGSKARRDGLVASVVGSIDAFVASTRFSGEYLAEFFPEIARDRIHTIELPSPSPVRKHERSVREAGREQSQVLRVAVPGNFTTIKGGDYLLDVMRLCGEYEIEFEILGRVEDRLREGIASVASGRVTVRDGYRASEVVGLLSESDLSLHLSIWPETYMLSLTEAWEAGLVPIVADLGGPADRVRHEIDGFKVPPNDPTSAFECIQRIYFDRGLLGRMQMEVHALRFPSRREHTSKIVAIYDDLIGRYPTIHSRVPDLAALPHPISVFDTGLRLNSPRWTTRENIWDGAEPATASSAGKLPDVVAEVELGSAEQALAVEIIGTGSGRGAYQLEFVLIDGRSSDARARDVAFEHITIRGWMIGDAREAPTATYARMKGPNGVATYRLTGVRADGLARQLGYPPEAAIVFEGTIPVRGLADGPHTLDLLQSTPRAMVIKTDVLTVTVQSPAVLGASAPVGWKQATHDDKLPTLASGRSDLVVGDQNLRAVGDLAIGTERDVWWIQGEFPGAVEVDELIAVLRSDHDDQVYHAPAHVLEGGSSGARFGVAVQLGSVAPGGYTLLLAMRKHDSYTAQPTGLRLYRSAGGSPCAVSDQPPAGFRPRSSWGKSRVSYSLDEVFRRPDEFGSPATALHSGRGWCFAPRLGPPTCTVVSWSEAGRTRYSICPPLLRPDIEAHKGVSEAKLSGFEFDLAAAALEDGPVRFFQCYPGRTVEVLGFNARLREALRSGGSARKTA